MGSQIKSVAKFIAGESDSPLSEGAQRNRKLVIIATVIAVALIASFLIHAWETDDTVSYPTNVGLAREVGADAYAHGATGKGNDQCRFQLAAEAVTGIFFSLQ